MIILILTMILAASPASSADEDGRSLVRITSDLAGKCREYRKKFDLKTTGKNLTNDAKRYRGLTFSWSDNGTASLLYHGMRGMILPSECQAPGEGPVDSIHQ